MRVLCVLLADVLQLHDDPDATDAAVLLVVAIAREVSA
jgi:hypothetical protein